MSEKLIKKIEEFEDDLKGELMEQFKTSEEISDDSSWMFLDGLAYCSICGKPYPACKGWHN